ncbi:MAG: sulfotransferase, partial [Candidatus Hodarchaeota archaeon]
MIYIVLGMHKSGTTLVSEILHKSGIHMIGEQDGHPDYDTGNKYERVSTANLNKDILQCWDIYSLDIPLPKHLELSDQQRRRMFEIIRECEATNAEWGFKDPRTCLTYPLWSAHLPDHRLVVIYRSPHQAWLHYKKHGPRRNPVAIGRQLLKVLCAWSMYNCKILEILRATSHKYLILSYERLMSEQFEFDRLSDFMGQDLVDARRGWSYRHRALESP